jgi:hypothetical protein
MITALWDGIPSCLIGRYLRFRRIYCFIVQGSSCALKMEAALSSITLVTRYRKTKRRILDGTNLKHTLCRNLKSHINRNYTHCKVLVAQ